MRPTYRPRTHDALYLDAAICLDIGNFDGEIGILTCGVQVRRTPEVYPMGGQVLLFGTDADRHGPVQEDDHGACRPAIRLITFCYLPTPVKPGGSRCLQRRRVIAADDRDFFRDMCNSRLQAYRSFHSCRTSDSASSLHSCEK